MFWTTNLSQRISNTRDTSSDLDKVGAIFVLRVQEPSRNTSLLFDALYYCISESRPEVSDSFAIVHRVMKDLVCGRKSFGGPVRDVNRRPLIYDDKQPWMWKGRKKALALNATNGELPVVAKIVARRILKCIKEYFISMMSREQASFWILLNLRFVGVCQVCILSLTPSLSGRRWKVQYGLWQLSSNMLTALISSVCFIFIEKFRNKMIASGGGQISVAKRTLTQRELLCYTFKIAGLIYTWRLPKC